MKDTANSNPIRPTKIENGIKVNIAKTILLENIWYKNVERIFINVCPATKLANNLTPKLTALAM
jgi:hypothetical protein